MVSFKTEATYQTLCKLHSIWSCPTSFSFIIGKNYIFYLSTANNPDYVYMWPTVHKERFNNICNRFQSCCSQSSLEAAFGELLLFCFQF